MHLVVYELTATPVIQEIEVGDRSIYVESFRPHLYKHLNPAGSMYIELRNLADVVLATSETVLISDVHNATGPYFHGVVRFGIDASLQANTKYRVALIGSGGYTFSESAYIGWCGGFDLKIVPNSYTPISTADEGLILEIWERRKLEKGIF